MFNSHKYWKSLLGQFAEVLITKQVEYTAEADYEAFVTNAPSGAIGFFNADTYALISGLAAVDKDTPIFAAVKRGTYVEKTLPFKLSSREASRAAYAAAVAQVSTATLAGNPVKGNYYSVKIIETTPGNQPFPHWEYGTEGKAGDTATTIAARIVALINDKSNAINKDTDSIVTASNAAGVITVTASKVGVTFRIAFSVACLEDLTAVATYIGAGTTKPSFGNGTYEQVVGLEQVSDVYKSVTTNFPDTVSANPEDFGKPESLVEAGVQYNIYLISGYQTEASPTPVEKHYQPHKVVLAIAANGAANPEAEVKTILGL